MLTAIVALASISVGMIIGFVLVRFFPPNECKPDDFPLFTGDDSD